MRLDETGESGPWVKHEDHEAECKRLRGALVAAEICLSGGESAPASTGKFPHTLAKVRVALGLPTGSAS